MLVFDPRKRATAADLCMSPEIHKYLTEHGLPGPGLSSMLTSPRVIETGADLTTVINSLKKCS